MTLTLVTALLALTTALGTLAFTLWRVHQLQGATLRATARARRLEKLLEGARDAAKTAASDPEILRFVA